MLSASSPVRLRRVVVTISDRFGNADAIVATSIVIRTIDIYAGCPTASVCTAPVMATLLAALYSLPSRLIAVFTL